MQSGHSEFGQAGFPQQYTFSSLPGVQANSTHDMSKQVQAAPQGIYSNSGPPSVQQHHQQSMGGNVQSPHPLVQPGQQMNRTQHMASIPNYYRPAPRMQNLGRNPLSSVVNQTGQPASQFNMLQQHQTAFHPHLQAMLVAAPPQMNVYGRPQFSQQYPVVLQSYYNGPYPNPPPTHQNANGFYQPGMAYNHSGPPQIPANPQSQQRKKNALPIVNPLSGKSIFDGDDESTSQIDKVTADSDLTICAQFAADVAALANDDKSKSKSSLLEDTRILEKQEIVLNPAEVNICENVEDGENGETVDMCEQYNDVRCNEKPAFKNEIDLNSVNASVVYEPKKCPPNLLETVSEPTDAYDYSVASDSIRDCPETECQKTEDVLQYYEIQDVTNLDVVTEPVLNDTTAESIEPTDIVCKPAVQESKPLSPNGEASESISLPASTLKLQEKVPAEFKKNRAKKKKDLNKKGDSKEGGEMDAFLDKAEEVAPAVSMPPPVPVLTSVDNGPPSPVPILDSEILDTIPLPDDPEPISIEPIDSPSELPSDHSSISPTVENEDKENVEEATNKIVLKYSYKEDQWSPLNPEGKKLYDRDFLLQLQAQPMSMVKPSNLPNLDVIKDKAHIQRLTEVNNRPISTSVPVKSYDPFYPVYIKGGPARPPHPPINRRSQQGRDKPKKVISFSSSLNQTVKLHESENAWKPFSKGEGAAEENPETQDLYKKVRGILNKLTPQKFTTLVEQVKNLDIDTEEKLNGVIDLVFEKAIDEPNFSVPYANMCKQLALIKVPLAGQTGQLVNFRKILLTKCQKEFEQDRSDELKCQERMKSIEAAETEEKKKVLQLEFDEEEKKMRYRQLGNIRFIGELFKLSMLIEPIMHECIQKLLTQKDEESLECLCRLLKTIGKELDEVKKEEIRRAKEADDMRRAKECNPMDTYFAEMQKIVDRRLTSSRVRFMLQDVIDLKKNNWVPRRDENNPKTIDQIHKEAEREAHEQQQVLQNMPYAKRLPDDRDRRKSNARIISSEDGWIPSSKSNKGSYSVVDPVKLKLTKPDEFDSIRLGPGGRGPSSWGRGSSGGTKAATVDSDLKHINLLGNRYSALADQSNLVPNYEARRGSQRSAASSRESSRGRNNPLPVRKTPSTSKEREIAIEAVKVISKPVPEQRMPDSKKEPHVNGKVSSVLALKGPELSQEELEKKTRPLIDEFLHNSDFEEAVKCVTELASPLTVYMLINAAINQVLERSSQARYLLGQLLYSLVKKNIITLEQYNKGFKSVLEYSSDYELDIPLIWDYLGEILEPMVEDSKLPLTFLKDVLQPCRPSLTAGKLVSAVLHCAAKKKGPMKMGELWRESGLQWPDFLEPDVNLKEFIHTYKLDFTISPTKVQPKDELTTEEIKSQLDGLLEKHQESEEIFDWIDGNVGANRVSESSFVRALVTAVYENAITGSGNVCELDSAKIKKRVVLLSRYLDHNEQLELQALYAVQALMNRLSQPKGIIKQIFDSLYDEDLINEETFKLWEQSTDPAEQEGKGVALLSASPFFTWLREAESGDEVDEYVPETCT